MPAWPCVGLVGAQVVLVQAGEFRSVRSPCGAMLVYFVTLYWSGWRGSDIPCIVNVMECVMCGREVSQTVGRGRRRLTCGQRCRKRLSRSAFPSEMVCARRWTRADGKRPVMADGSAASSTNPDTWATFAAVQSGAGDGFGFMLGGGFGCIDVDHCVDGDVLDSRGTAVVAANPAALVELSMSGTGIHVFGRMGEAPGRRRDGVEVYSRARFIRVTGDVWQSGGLVGLVA